MSTKLPTKPLGRNGPQIPRLGFGMMGLSCGLPHNQPGSYPAKKANNSRYLAFYGVPAADEERFELLNRVYELGCVHWDSAALYGDSEELIGKWFQRTGKRREVSQVGPVIVSHKVMLSLINSADFPGYEVWKPCDARRGTRD